MVKRSSENNFESEKVLSEFRASLASAKKSRVPLAIGNSREELLKIKENITKKRLDIPGADAMIEYIEEVLIAGLDGYVVFKE